MAIKKLQIIEDVIDAKWILREIKCLHHFRHENIIKLIDINLVESKISKYKQIYLIIELMDVDLNKIIR